MKYAMASLIIVTIVIFCGAILAIDLAVEHYKKWRKRRDAFIPDYTVGAFRGVQEQKKW